MIKNDYFLIFNQIYQSIINNYNLEIKIINENTIMIYKKNFFALKFIMWTETVSLFYLDIASSENIACYDISDFIVSYMTSTDRECSIPKVGNIIYDRNVRYLKYLSNTLNNHFIYLLMGDTKWFEEYKKSTYYVEPRIIKSIFNYPMIN